MTEPEQQQPALVENMLLLRREDFDELLDRVHAATGVDAGDVVLVSPQGHEAFQVGLLQRLVELLGQDQHRQLSAEPLQWSAEY